ncbi:MAG: ParB/RepB/Spo0J family partition protein [Saprospiraceae bacterium]
MAKKKFNEGNGLKSLLGGINMDHSKGTPEDKTDIVAMIPIGAIEVNPWQPRSKFEVEAMNDLIESIEQYGLIQPVTVRKLNAHSFQLISGERRVRACKKAGLKEIPAYIREASDEEMMEMALVENLERSDLNPMEIASTYGLLKKEYKWTDETLAKRVDKRRSSVTNYLRLLSLPEVIQTALRDKEISMGHAKAICGVDVLLQTEMYNRIKENELSVRATEALASAYNNPKKISSTKDTVPATITSAYRDIEDGLCKMLDRKVQLKRKSNGKGQIVIPFTNDTDLNSILEFLEKDSF